MFKHHRIIDGHSSHNEVSMFYPMYMLFICSMLQLEHDIDQLSLTEKSSSSSTPSPTVAHSAPVTPVHKVGADDDVDVSYRGRPQTGFFEGLLGCLRPVWTIIGKAAAAELKQQGKI